MCKVDTASRGALSQPTAGKGVSIGHRHGGYSRRAGCVEGGSGQRGIRHRSWRRAETDDSGDNDHDHQSDPGQDDDAGNHSVSPPLVLASFADEEFWTWGCLCGLCRHSATITSIMLDVKVDRGEDIALHDQVAAEIRRAIADGEAAPGERLPPAKDLAAVLGVNANTVLRALRLLRDEGLLELRRGRGVTVTGTPDRSDVLSRTRELLEYARIHGYRREDVIEMIARLP